MAHMIAGRRGRAEIRVFDGVRGDVRGGSGGGANGGPKNARHARLSWRADANARRVSRTSAGGRHRSSARRRALGGDGAAARLRDGTTARRRDGATA
ncbi:hypothetical protein WT60_23010 [Burkholderia sp. MSMB617WGS]|nr:hypothetical protein WT60_23010 [Burkholderia sp. MSMB617WGS]KVK78512.1 hypothetical protein WS91_14670 [Burkholderia sp. MSMB1498]KWZ47914.1 hypothetical protein WS73_05075 [Burkholderia savannae]